MLIVLPKIYLFKIFKKQNFETAKLEIEKFDKMLLIGVVFDV